MSQSKSIKSIEKQISNPKSLDQSLSKDKITPIYDGSIEEDYEDDFDTSQKLSSRPVQGNTTG